MSKSTSPKKSLAASDAFSTMPADAFSEDALESSKSVSTPTLKKWLKTNPDQSEGKLHAVQKIWLPNRYPTYAFCTDDYRFIIYKEDTRYVQCESLVNKAYEEGLFLYVQPNEAYKSAGTIKLLDDGKVCPWDCANDGYLLFVKG